MSIQPPADLLSVLHANLRRIEEQHRDENLTPAALEIKQLLLRRIANIEAAIGNINALIRKATPEETTDTIHLRCKSARAISSLPLPQSLGYSTCRHPLVSRDRSRQQILLFIRKFGNEYFGAIIRILDIYPDSLICQLRHDACQFVIHWSPPVGHGRLSRTDLQQVFALTEKRQHFVWKSPLIFVRREPKPSCAAAMQQF
jgi:hypothetical protein